MADQVGAGRRLVAEIARANDAGSRGARGEVHVEGGQNSGDVIGVIFYQGVVARGGVVLALQVERHDGHCFAVDDEALLVRDLEGLVGPDRGASGLRVDQVEVRQVVRFLVVLVEYDADDNAALAGGDKIVGEGEVLQRVHRHVDGAGGIADERVQGRGRVVRLR